MDRLFATGGTRGLSRSDIPVVHPYARGSFTTHWAGAHTVQRASHGGLWQRRTPSFWPTGSRRLPRHPERAVGRRGRRWPSTVVWSRCQSLSTLCSLWAPCSRPQSIVRRLNTLRWRSASPAAGLGEVPQATRSIQRGMGPSSGLFGIPRLRLRRARGAAHRLRQGTLRHRAHGSVVSSYEE